MRFIDALGLLATSGPGAVVALATDLADDGPGLRISAGHFVTSSYLPSLDGTPAEIPRWEDVNAGEWVVVPPGIVDGWARRRDTGRAAADEARRYLDRGQQSD